MANVLKSTSHRIGSFRPSIFLPAAILVVLGSTASLWATGTDKSRAAATGAAAAGAASLPGDAGLTPGGCLPNDTTLCIDDEPSDLRFEVSVDFFTALNGGSSGPGKGITLIPLGIRRGGLFWFFDPTNPELLIKVLNGCDITGHYWIFWSAGTNVGLTLRVTDTVTQNTVTYTNPDGQTASPVTDTMALLCS